MRCRRSRRQLSAYLDDEVDPRPRASLESHLAACEACSAELARLKAQSAALAEADRVPELPPDLWGRVLAALDEAERMPWHQRHRGRLLRAACVTACVVLGFAGGALVSWRAPALERASESTSIGERRLVAEAFDVTLFGLGEEEEGLFRCARK
jgi:anti-sigma factor RsiW